VVGLQRERLPEDATLVAVRRGALVESAHRGRAAVCDPQGEIVEAVGDVAGYVYARSSAKPFQAILLVLSGAANAIGLTDEELAVACASHKAEEPHLAAVRSILEKAGLSERDLQSGAHPPLYAPAAEELARSGEEPRAIHSNCSGKHAGMLALCVHEGWGTGGYRSPEHPLQRWILEIVATICDLETDEILLSGDGCGVPVFGMPLRNLATGFARLATGEELPEDLAASAARIRGVMREHPFMVAGTGSFDTIVMRGTDLVSKSGAEGMFCAGSQKGWGLALKISDGAGRALRTAALSILARRSVDVPGTALSRPVRDLHGEAVGEIEPLLYGPGAWS
jgi:L-asparaginase II